MTDFETPSEFTSTASGSASGPAPAGRIPAHQWRLLLPLALMVLTAGAYLWQQRQSVDTGPVGQALARQAELAARVDGAARRAAGGERAAFAGLRRLRTQSATAQADTRTALMASEVLSSRARLASALDDIDAAWRLVHGATDRLLELESATSTLRADVEAFQSIATGILVTTDELVDALVAAEESPAQIRTAARQLLLIQRISANVRRVLEGGDGVITAADRFGRDAVLFGEVNISLLNGNPRLGIQRIRAPAARDTLVDIGREFRRGTELIEQIMSDAVAMVDARQAAAIIGEHSARVISLAGDLQRELVRLNAERSPRPMVAEIFGLLAVFSLLVVMAHIAASTRRERIAARTQAAKAARRESERSEREWRLESRERATDDAIRRLIDELDRLGRVEAPVNPQFRTGISDTPLAPLEVAVGALRHRMRTLIQAAIKLANAGADFSRTASSARTTAHEQSKEVERAASATRQMAAHVEMVSERGRKAERIGGETHALVSRAQSALQAAASQSEETFTTAKVTAARVRQLNESTRQIEEVGRLVDEISEQCRMLSLNVSIRASLSERSGDSGASRFADEIKKLSDNARRAMRRIENVNEDVRSHAGQAADSVKRIMWSAEKSAARNKEAGKEVTNAAVLAQRMEMLNRQLVEALQEHTKLMTDVVKSTTSVHGIAARARQEFREVAERATRLAELAGLLETTVAGFDRPYDAPRGVIELHPPRPVEPDEQAVNGSGNTASDPEAADGPPADAPKEATGKD